jgi:hypothetical protein
MRQNDGKLNEAIAYLHGKIETQLEFYSNAAGLDARMVTARMGALLSGAWQRADGGVPVRLESSPGRGRGEAVADVEGGEQPHGRGASHRAAKGRRKGTKTGKAVSGIKAYWAAMTPEERAKEVARRQRRRHKNEATAGEAA